MKVITKIRHLVLHIVRTLCRRRFLYMKRKYCHKYMWCDQCEQNCKLKKFAELERLGD